MRDKIKGFLHGLVTSRMFVLGILFTAGAFVLLGRIFTLQIVRGEYYLDNFQLKIIRERSIASTRGNIYDRNGNILAYNELAYSVVIEDIFDDEEDKNAAMNDVILKLCDIIEKNGDHVISDFGITLNEDGQFAFSYTDTRHLRFLADIYGYAKTDKLKYDERNSTPEDVVDYFCKKKKYAIGSYATDEDGRRSDFIPREGYTNEEILKLITIRYSIDLNAFKKYVTTTVATDISDETVAAVYENEDILKGVSVSRDTVRRYKDSVYFSQIIGYTGMISQQEYDDILEKDPDNTKYTMNDFVGKTGMELAMEDARILYRKLEKNEGISGNSNVAAEMGTGDYLALLDHDDLLAPNALYEMRSAIDQTKADFVYSDELTFQSPWKDKVEVVRLKPGFAPDTLLTNNYICHFTVFSRALWNRAGGFRPEYDGSQDHDLFLRLTGRAKGIAHVSKVLYLWRSIPGSVAEDIQHKDYAGVVQNEEFRYAQADGQKFDSVLQAQFVLAFQRHNESFTYRDVTYNVFQEGEDLYRVTLAEDDTTIGIAYKDIVTSSVEGQKVSFDVAYNALLAFTNDETEFSAEGGDYTIDEAGVVTLNGEEIAFISRYVVNPVMSDVFLSRDFQEELVGALGLPNDHMVYSDSILYQKYTTTRSLSEVDWLMLNMLYSPVTRPDMTWSEAEDALINWMGL